MATEHNKILCSVPLCGVRCSGFNTPHVESVAFGCYKKLSPDLHSKLLDLQVQWLWPTTIRDCPPHLELNSFHQVTMKLLQILLIDSLFQGYFCGIFGNRRCWQRWLRRARRGNHWARFRVHQGGLARPFPKIERKGHKWTGKTTSQQDDGYHSTSTKSWIGCLSLIVAC